MYITQFALRLPSPLIDNGLDLPSLAVVANDDFQVRVALENGTQQSTAEELWVKGGNGNADKWLFDHGGKPGEAFG
ncbi:hypothetical protein D3C77_698370 [compost metagenome]